MRCISTTITLFSLLFVELASPITTWAQGASCEDPAKDQLPSLGYQSLNAKLHPLAVVGSTPERLAALRSATPEQLRALSEQLRPYFEAALEKAMKEHQADLKSRDIRAQVGALNEGAFKQALSAETIADGTMHSSSSEVGALLFERPGPLIEGSTPDQAIDDDHDGLPDEFEQQLADAFTPFYHVSRGEPDNFSTFYDYVPMTPWQRLGPNPFSYFRVKPMGFAIFPDGFQYGAIQINYLTLWDHDSGLEIGGDCYVAAGFLGGIVGLDLVSLMDGLHDHYLDWEHSAALFFAPTPSPYTYSFNVLDYKGYSYYTAAHEHTFVDHSAYFNPGTPVDPYWHLNIWLSRRKHSSYIFNPDHFPILPAWLINSTYDTLFFLWVNYIIDDLTYALALGAADTVFLSCVVEHMDDPGGVYALQRVNVGEPVIGSILNQSGFIMDTNYVYPILTETIWTVP